MYHFFCFTPNGHTVNRNNYLNSDVFMFDNIDTHCNSKTRFEDLTACDRSIDAVEPNIVFPRILKQAELAIVIQCISREYEAVL